MGARKRRKGVGPHGILVVDKPAGQTSHDVVQRVRKLYGTRSVGHAGTLDPMATGVLVLGLGEGTKALRFFADRDKVYETLIALGEETVSLDADGEITRRVPVPDGWQTRVDAALDTERQRSSQIPPRVSAIHVGGRRAHALVRSGEAFELEPRPVSVHAITVDAIETHPPSIALKIHVGSGYYVRSLARDLAEALGTVGHLAQLRRVRCAEFDAAGAANLAPMSAGAPLPAPEPLERALARIMPMATLDSEGTRDARAGRRVAPDHIDAPRDRESAWLAPDGRLVAVGHVDSDGVGRVVRGFFQLTDDAEGAPTS